MTRVKKFLLHESMECVVCYKITAAKVEPCGHVVCERCAKKWMHLSSKCPMCRNNFVLNFEKSSINTFFWRLLNIDFGPRIDLIGVILKSCQFGVFVSGTKPNTEAKQKLRCNDLITHINKMRTISHMKTAEAIRAQVLGFRMTVWRPPFWWDWKAYHVRVFNESS